MDESIKWEALLSQAVQSVLNMTIASEQIAQPSGLLLAVQTLHPQMLDQTEPASAWNPWFSQEEGDGCAAKD
ncbi:MAG: hypothetical protein OWS74_00795 [Firmicutes bacterium]|nr:hypothetical protein [Bacillota bacterium]